jgi:hypothetical protein
MTFIEIFWSFTSTDPILALALAMSICTHCSAILTQSYGISSVQLWQVYRIILGFGSLDKCYTSETRTHNYGCH